MDSVTCGWCGKPGNPSEMSSIPHPTEPIKVRLHDFACMVAFARWKLIVLREGAATNSPALV